GSMRIDSPRTRSPSPHALAAPEALDEAAHGPPHLLELRVVERRERRRVEPSRAPLVVELGGPLLAPALHVIAHVIPPPIELGAQRIGQRFAARPERIRET